jgi:hypothetical protein
MSGFFFINSFAQEPEQSQQSYLEKFTIVVKSSSDFEAKAFWNSTSKQNNGNKVFKLKAGVARRISMSWPPSNQIENVRIHYYGSADEHIEITDFEIQVNNKYQKIGIEKIIEYVFLSKAFALEKLSLQSMVLQSKAVSTTSPYMIFDLNGYLERRSAVDKSFETLFKIKTKSDMNLITRIYYNLKNQFDFENNYNLLWIEKTEDFSIFTTKLENINELTNFAIYFNEVDVEMEIDEISIIEKGREHIFQAEEIAGRFYSTDNLDISPFDSRRLSLIKRNWIERNYAALYSNNNVWDEINGVNNKLYIRGIFRDTTIIQINYYTERQNNYGGYRAENSRNMFITSDEKSREFSTEFISEKVPQGFEIKILLADTVDIEYLEFHSKDYIESWDPGKMVQDFKIIEDFIIVDNKLSVYGDAAISMESIRNPLFFQVRLIKQVKFCALFLLATLFLFYLNKKMFQMWNQSSLNNITKKRINFLEFD